MGACLGTNIDAHTTNEPPQEQESYLSSLACSLAPSLVEKHFVQTAVQALARPPRRAYGRDALGPSRTGREGLIVTREDVVAHLCGYQIRAPHQSASVAASVRWRGDSTPSTRRCPHGRVGSMAWGLTKVTMLCVLLLLPLPHEK